MRLERKFMAVEGLTLAETEAGPVVEGHASLWGIADRGGDVVERGAFAASLARLAVRGEGPRMLWQHDPAQPIGVWDEVREDARGLFVRGRILTEVARGREAAALVRASAIDGLSIGYRPIRADRDGQGRRRLPELELWEVSLVTFPMLPEARLSAKRDPAAGEAPAARGDARTFHDLARAVALARTRLRA